MIRLKTTFNDISADTLYDVLHDPLYRKVFLDLEKENPCLLSLDPFNLYSIQFN